LILNLLIRSTYNQHIIKKIAVFTYTLCSSRKTPLYQYHGQISLVETPVKKKLNIWQDLSPGGKTLTLVKKKDFYNLVEKSFTYPAGNQLNLITRGKS